MKEKERYELLDDYDIDVIVDNITHSEFTNGSQFCSLLNQQDKRIKELKKENLSLQEQSIRDNQNWVEETTKLKRQLHDLPKKIVGEIEKYFTEYLPLKYKTGAWFYGKLNEILKKYGGKDE